MKEQLVENKEAFIKEALAAFEEALNDTKRRKHAVFLVFDDATEKMQTFTFNADMPMLLMMISSAYSMMEEATSGTPLRVLN